MTERVLLACGDVGMALHGGAHDGLPVNHPTCIIHAGEPGGLSCKVAATPDLTGRTAFCQMYGSEPYKGGPIYPDDKTRNGGLCARDGCFCVVPSDIRLPFFSFNVPDYELRCAVQGSGVGYDARGHCIYRPSAHDPARGRGRATALKLITLKYPKAHCGQCGVAIKVGAVAEWGKDSNGHGTVYHLIDQCPPLSHKFVARTDLGQDSFYCGCNGWD